MSALFVVDKTAPLPFISLGLSQPEERGRQSAEHLLQRAGHRLGPCRRAADARRWPQSAQRHAGLSHLRRPILVARRHERHSRHSKARTRSRSTAANSDIRDLAGNPLALDASITWQVDTTPPTLDIVDISPDPRTTSISQATIVFSESVTNFTLADLHLFRDGTEIALPIAQRTDDFRQHHLDRRQSGGSDVGRWQLPLEGCRRWQRARRGRQSGRRRGPRNLAGHYDATGRRCR